MLNRASTTLILLFAAAPLSQASTPQAQPSAQARPHLDQLLGAWRTAHGDSWRLATDVETGRLELLYGGNAATGLSPRNDAEFIALARETLAQTAAMHGIEAATLVPDQVMFLPLGQIGSGDKTTVRLRQELDGVRVVGGFVNVLFDAQGRLLSIQSKGLPDIARLSRIPGLSASDAVGRVLNAFSAETGLAANEIDLPELVIEQQRVGGTRVGRLAWQIDARWRMDDVEPEGFTYWIDAHDGSVLRRTSNILNFDVTGTVKSMATPGTLPDVSSNPETSHTMPYMRVTSSSGTRTTDINGNFTYAGVNSPLSVTVTYFGTYNNVTNSAGSSYSLTTTLQPNQANTITMNPSSTATTTAQANAFRVVNLMREFIRSINPTDSHGDFVARARVNQNNTCNAVYDGAAINFYLQGGGCKNSAYSTIISHEHGHWMNDKYNTGNGGDGMGEGNADVWSMYLWDTPIVGAVFSGTGPIRTGLNTTPFCGDTHSACYGEVHADGEPWMGAAWKLREHLNDTHGNVDGDSIANHLFLAWMNGYNQTQIKSIIETQWLTLDDNDGNINNGTPHLADINQGFVDQGFPGVGTNCAEPTSFCIAAPNTFTDEGAQMFWAGSAHLSTNDFVLTTVGCPPNASALYFYGQTQSAPAVFGNGFRCIANPFVRLPGIQANEFGDATYEIDLNALPPGGQINAGQTWNFQLWYRNPAAGGAGFNASNALSVPWCL